MDGLCFFSNVPPIYLMNIVPENLVESRRIVQTFFRIVNLISNHGASWWYCSAHSAWIIGKSASFGRLRDLRETADYASYNGQQSTNPAVT